MLFIVVEAVSPVVCELRIYAVDGVHYRSDFTG